MSSPKAAFMQHNYIIKTLGTGFSGEVVASIPHPIADRLVAEYRLSEKTLDQVCQELLAAVEAGKISTSDKKPFALDEEVDIMRGLRRYGNANIAAIRESQGGEPVTWFTQELLGARLEQLSELYTSGASGVPLLPTAFVWHMIAQLSRPLLLYDFNIVDKDTRAVRAAYSHNDFHPGNIMFRPSANRRAYPDAVLIDFGNSVRLRQSSRQVFLEQQRKDVMNLVLHLEAFGNKVDEPDETLTSLSERVPSVKVGAENNLELRDWLVKLRRVAERRRRELYRPLPDEVRIWLAEAVVSKAEIVNTFDLHDSA